MEDVCYGLFQNIVNTVLSTFQRFKTTTEFFKETLTLFQNCRAYILFSFKCIVNKIHLNSVNARLFHAGKALSEIKYEKRDNRVYHKRNSALYDGYKNDMFTRQRCNTFIRCKHNLKTKQKSNTLRVCKFIAWYERYLWLLVLSMFPAAHTFHIKSYNNWRRQRWQWLRERNAKKKKKKNCIAVQIYEPNGRSRKIQRKRDDETQDKRGYKRGNKRKRLRECATI